MAVADSRKWKAAGLPVPALAMQRRSVLRRVLAGGDKITKEVAQLLASFHPGAEDAVISQATKRPDHTWAFRPLGART